MSLRYRCKKCGGMKFFLLYRMDLGCLWGSCAICQNEVFFGDIDRVADNYIINMAKDIVNRRTASSIHAV